MILQKLILNNFRNHNESVFSFSDRINVIHGKNGHGKTSILEAINFLAFTQSFKSQFDKDCINFNENKNHFHIQGDFYDKYAQKHQIKVDFNRFQGKKIEHNKQTIVKYRDHIGFIPTVLLKPDDLKISFAGPAERRLFLDLLLSQLSKTYMENLIRYKKAVRHKNSLLSQENKSRSELLDAWDRTLVKFALPIIEKRSEIIQSLNANANKYFQLISSQSSKLEIKYLPNTGKITELSENKLIMAMAANRDKELRQQQSLIGPHRDDFDMCIDGKTVSVYSSQGENKSVIIALKLAEMSVLTEHHVERPLLLFDDIFSELDKERCRNLLKLAKEIGQVFISTTDKSIFRSRDFSYFHIQNGKVLA